ncbi:MAG TPA: dihydrofolate reductase family protein [Gaiellaceae bacterium]|nr:dihydrofolate reductase family protein [Gaiellaceae bacterium]
MYRPVVVPDDVVYYAAASLDGYIATADGGVDWLSDAPSGDYGYDAFFAEVGSIVTGRTTFDQAVGFAWAYGDKPAAVLTSTPLGEDAPASAFAWDGSDPAGLVARLRREARGRVWILGGSRAAGLFLREGLLDAVELGVIPVLLGDGIPLFPDDVGLHRLEPVEARAVPGAGALLRYRVRR